MKQSVLTIFMEPSLFCYLIFLPGVMLEHTFNNGKWITSTDKKWPNDDVFDKTTLKKI